MDVQQIDKLRKDIQAVKPRLDLLTLDLSRRASVETYHPDIALALARLQQGIGQSNDVQIRELRVPAVDGLVLVVSIDGITDARMVDYDVVTPLLGAESPPDQRDSTISGGSPVTRETSWTTLLDALAEGSTLVMAQGLPFVWVVSTPMFPERSVDRPKTEMSVRGPQEAFTEILATQKAQIRSYIRNPALSFVDLTVGETQQQAVAIAYIDGTANPNVVETARLRLSAVQVSGVTSSNQIGELIRDHPRSLFPTIRATERVDIVIWRLMQGAVAVLVNGDPFVLLAPAPLVDFYRTSMDYSTSWPDATFTRMIRFVAWILGIYLPAMYLAIADVNPNLLPSDLFILMQGNHSGLPFSPTVEIVLMIIVIEVLREAAIRLPTVLSTTIGTVGAIVVGTAIVRAGLVDPQIIVMMTLTALALFASPTYELTGVWRVVGFSMLIGAAVLGLLGIILITMGMLVVVMDMESFGVPYFTPWTPFRLSDQQDTLVRLPWSMVTRHWTAYRPQKTTWRVPSRPATPPRLRKGGK